MRVTQRNQCSSDELVALRLQAERTPLDVAQGALREVDQAMTASELRAFKDPFWSAELQEARRAIVAVLTEFDYRAALQMRSRLN